MPSVLMARSVVAHSKDFNSITNVGGFIMREHPLLVCFFLLHHIEDFVDGRQLVKCQNLTTNSREGLVIQTHQKLMDFVLFHQLKDPFGRAAVAFGYTNIIAEFILEAHKLDKNSTTFILPCFHDAISAFSLCILGMLGTEYRFLIFPHMA